MKALIYAGGEYVTGDAIVEAVLDYAEILAISGSSAQVTFPALGDGDAVIEATVLIGPASQIAARDAQTDRDDIVDDRVVADIRTRARRMKFGAESSGNDHDTAESAPAKWTDDF